MSTLPSKLSETQELVKRNSETDWPDITEQKRAFALNYILSYNVREAAKECGVAVSKANEFLRDPLLSAYIKYLQDERAVTNFITEDFIRTQYLNLLPKLMGEEEIPVVTGTGDEVSVRRFFPGEAVNVIKELAKSTKFYENGSGEKAAVEVHINMGDLLGPSPKEVDRIIIADGEE